jgi:hypothetical protein
MSLGSRYAPWFLEELSRRQFRSMTGLIVDIIVSLSAKSLKIYFSGVAFAFTTRAESFSRTRRTYWDVDSLDALAADSICCQSSSAMRKYRFGIWPVGGRPIFGLSVFCSMMPTVYVHPNILSN